MSNPVTPSPEITDVGMSGILVTFSEAFSDSANRAALSFRAAIDALKIPGISETTTSLTATFIAFDPLALPRETLRARLETLLQSTDFYASPLPQNRRLWRIPTLFDGPQLADAAALAQVSEAEAVSQICAEPLRVMTIGFAPGLPYLGTLPPNWDIPRQSGLTKEVPIGALCVAIRQLVLFPTASPTGWRQLARCAFSGFDPEAAEPFALTPGDQIVFTPVSAQDFPTAQAQSEPAP